jgi:hypothetical protein
LKPVLLSFSRLISDDGGSACGGALERRSQMKNPDTGIGPDRGPTTSTPRWVKVFGVIVIVLVLLVVIMMFIGGGSHGPGRHTPAGGPGGRNHGDQTRDENQEQEIDTSDGGGHDPAKGAHR